MDYSDIGLNSRLQSVDSLAARDRKLVTGYDFDNTTERDAVTTVHVRNASITSAKIDSFNFNQGTGGTLVLGGTNNGNGAFNLRNAAGANIISMDNTGMTVANGSITIKDANGTNIVDSTGIVSTTQFPFESQSLPLGQDVTAALASPVDVGGTAGTASYSIVTSRSTNVLFLWTMRGFISSQSAGAFNGNGIVALKIGTNSIIGADTMVVGGDSTAAGTQHTIISSYTAHQVKQLPAGTTTCKLISWIDQGGSGNAKLVITSMVFSYIQLGK